MDSFKKYFINDTTNELNWEYIDNLPEFAKLKECQQNPKWHGEGNAYEHTRRAVEALEKVAPRMTFEKKRKLAIAVLFHDIGKGVTTTFSKENWHSYGHEIEGEKIARRMLWDENFDDREYVCSLVRWHMNALQMFDSKNFFTNLLNTASNVSIYDLAIVKQCDIEGSVIENNNIKEQNLRQIKYLKDMAYIVDSRRYEDFFYDGVFNGGKNYYMHPNMDDVQEVMVMIGLPGAGKDSYIKEFLEYYNSKEDKRKWKVVCRDDIRYELGFCGKDEKLVCSPKQEEQVSEVFNARLKQYVAEGYNVIINNINLKRKYRDGYHNLLRDYNVKYCYLYVEAPTLQDNIERRKGQIEPEVFNKLIENFEWPTHSEYYSLDILKQKK